MRGAAFWFLRPLSSYGESVFGSSVADFLRGSNPLMNKHHISFVMLSCTFIEN